MRQRLADATWLQQVALRGWRRRARQLTVRQLTESSGRVRVLHDFFGSLQELQGALSAREAQLAEQQQVHEAGTAENERLRNALQEAALEHSREMASAQELTASTLQAAREEAAAALAAARE